MHELVTGKTFSYPSYQRSAVASPDAPWYQQRLNNLYSAAQDANSIVGTAVDVVEGKPLKEALRRQLPRYVPPTGMRPEFVEKLPQIVEKAQFNDYLKDTIRRARQLKPELREEFIFKQAEELNDGKQKRQLILQSLRSINQ